MMELEKSINTLLVKMRSTLGTEQFVVPDVERNGLTRYILNVELTT